MYTVYCYVLNFYYTTSFHQLTLLMHRESYTDKSKKRGGGILLTPFSLNYSRTERVWQETSRLETGMSPTFFYGVVPTIEDKEEANPLKSVH